MVIITLFLILGAGLVFWRKPSLRRQILWGAGLTIPLIGANLWLAGSFDHLGSTAGAIVVTITLHLIAVMALGGVLAALYEVTMSRWLTSIRSARRHTLLWLIVGLLTSVIAVAFGVPVFLAMVIGLFLNALLVVLIDWRMFWDVIIGSLGFAVWYGFADVLFGFRFSGNITAILLGPQPIGVTIGGLSPERLLVMAGLGCFIGSIFVAVKRYRLPDVPISASVLGWKLVSSSVLVIGVCITAAWFTWSFVQPPHVIAVTPSAGTTDVRSDATLVVTFSRPVNRDQLHIDIQPPLSGSWTFTNGQSERHAFRTATFTADIPLTPDTTYVGSIDHIASLWGLYGPDQTVRFTTDAAPVVVTPVPPIVEPVPVVPAPIIDTNTAPPITPVVTVPTPTPVVPATHRVQLSVAQDYQDAPLSCEAAALKMALAAKGVKVSESDIMKIVGYDSTPHQGGVWGNPHNAFVGNIAGKQDTTGYGVYWEPIARAAQHWRTARTLTNGTVTDLTAAIDAGNAVVIWGTLGHAYRDDWVAPDGTKITAWKGEHARTLIGYIGTQAQPTSFIINDPVVGRVTWSTATLLANWSAFNRSAVVVE